MPGTKCLLSQEIASFPEALLTKCIVDGRKKEKTDVLVSSSLMSYHIDLFYTVFARFLGKEKFGLSDFEYVFIIRKESVNVAIR